MTNQEYKKALENRILKNMDLLSENITPEIRLPARLQIKKDWEELYGEKIDYSFFA